MPAVDPRLLVGPETLDDAAALKVSDELAICFTADFITPLVDDPFQWGRIAAANSISDIYAMGATPLAALNLVCWPNCLPLEMLGQLLAGGASAAADSNCLVVGGHTVDDKQPKYGMAVIGAVHPDRILRNTGAVAGDRIYLTKPLGTGIIATAMKAEFAAQDELDASAQSMSTLNRAAAEAAVASGARALTDVTGFGLAGHLSEMLGREGNLGASISLDALPILPGVQNHMAMGMIPGGAYRNRDAYQQRVALADGADEGLEILLYDPQTSGGLLAAIPPQCVAAFEEETARRGVPARKIGQFDDSGKICVS
jgi:selenide,water dikinase